MKVSKCIITFFLAIAMLVSVCPFAMAASASGVLVDSASVNDWNSWLAASGQSSSNYWSYANQNISANTIGLCDSLFKLNSIVSLYDVRSDGFFESFTEIFEDIWNPDYTVLFDDNLGVYRPYDLNSHLWFVNSKGHFPYYRPESDSGEEDPDQEPYRTGQWVERSKVGTDTALWHVASNYELNEYRDQWLDLYSNAKITETTNYYWLTIQTATAVWVLCDKYGYPYYLPKDGKTAIGTENNYYQDTTNQYIDDDSVHVEVQDGGSALVGSPIDVNNGIVNVGGEVFYIDELIYDASTQTYYVDAHDEYVFNSTTNNYTTNNYSLTIQYHIDHTSITYIGQTEEYEKRYEMYFELPDGRSSADLTAEDLEQLSVAFSDVIQYVRTADNLDLRALYHFDGNVDDSSYWSYCSKFDWIAGASLTYMDEGTFGGSLYLDETDHTFTLTLPNNDAAADWTLQFRYYQSHTPAPVTDSLIDVGGHVVLMFSGAEYQTASGSKLAATSVGTWNEICIMRSGNVLYYYLNGVYLGSVADAVYHGNYIKFHFGSQQQTYKKIDELRFTSSIVYSPGLNYTPTAVPYDSNLTLVLPDTGTLEEQGIGLVPAEDNLLADIGLDDWTSSNVVKYLNSDVAAFFTGDGVDGNYYPDPKDGISIRYNPNAVLFSQADGATHVSFSSRSWYGAVTAADGNSYRGLYSSLFLPIVETYGTNYHFAAGYPGSFGFEIGKLYTFSVVLSDGSYSKLTFKLNPVGSGSTNPVSYSRVYCDDMQVNVTYMGSVNASDDLATVWGILIYPTAIDGSAKDTSFDIVYMELVEGTQPQFQFSKLYSGDSLDPDEVIPDEYVQVNKPLSGNMLDSYGLSDWGSDDFSWNVLGNEKVSLSSYGTQAFAADLKVMYNTKYVSVASGGRGTVVNFGGDVYSDKNGSNVDLQNALFLPLSNYSVSDGISYFGTSLNTVYTLSVVLADGSSSSLTFSFSNYHNFNVRSKCINSVIDFRAGYVGVMNGNSNGGIFIYSDVADSAEIIYMELVAGSEPLYSCSRVVSVYSADELSGSPVLAVRTNREITGYQIGGVRPSYPTTGLVYAMVENGRIVSLQQYTGYAWEAVDGRIWTGERWIPYSSFDVFTLQDFYDIIGSSGDDYEYIYTESGFWAWWQKQWNQFTDTLFGLLEKILKATSGGGGDLSISIENNTIIDEEDKEPFNPDVYKGVIKTLRNGVKFFSGFFGFIYDGVNNFIVYLTDTSSEFYGLFYLSELG